MATQEMRQATRDKHPDSWVAVIEGDTLIGKVEDIVEAWSDQRKDPNTGKQGSLYPLLTVTPETADGYDPLPVALKVHCFGTVLFNEVMRKQPEVGERIRIIYRGQGEAKKGQNAPELYAFTVAGRKDAGARAYAAIGQATAPPTPAAAVQTELPPADDSMEDIPF